MQNLVFRVRSILRTNEGCMDTLESGGVRKTVDYPNKYLDEAEALTSCIENGTDLPRISERNQCH